MVAMQNRVWFTVNVTTYPNSFNEGQTIIISISTAYAQSIYEQERNAITLGLSTSYR